jgi:hypothetical protein
VNTKPVTLFGARYLADFQDMDDLVEAFDTLPPEAAEPFKLDLLLRLDVSGEPAHLAAFWQRVLLDTRQPSNVRTDALKRLRAHARTCLRTLITVARADPDPRIRLRATTALGDHADNPDVRAGLGGIVVDARESLEQRYFALTSLARGGPLPTSITLLESVVDDEDLGRTASAILSRWQARLRRESRQNP